MSLVVGDMNAGANMSVNVSPPYQGILAVAGNLTIAGPVQANATGSGPAPRWNFAVATGNLDHSCTPTTMYGEAHHVRNARIGSVNILWWSTTQEDSPPGIPNLPWTYMAEYAREYVGRGFGTRKRWSP
jgi:hypothetical protein